MQKIERLMKMTNSIQITFKVSDKTLEEGSTPEIIFDWFLEEFTDEVLKLRILVEKN